MKLLIKSINGLYLECKLDLEKENLMILTKNEDIFLDCIFHSGVNFNSVKSFLLNRTRLTDIREALEKSKETKCILFDDSIEVEVL